MAGEPADVPVTEVPIVEVPIVEVLAEALTDRTAMDVPQPHVPVMNIANYVTFFRLVLVPVFGYLLLHNGGDHSGWRVAAVIVFAVASISDRVDGELARSRGLVTEFGKIADPIADKALMGMALVGLSMLDELAWWVTVVILVREIGVTVLRFSVIRHGVIPASRGGKGKTLLQSLAIGLYLLPLPHWADKPTTVVMGAAVLITIVTGVDYVFRAIALRRRSKVSAARRTV
ncbi:MAG: CDP-diacylglycerol--glycerol-3-phosphate 3-phosphatidyltransferase [Frankiales bacterium]|nr:CDP-diacylglycerol--glycerol-3-phosphate 3-phosphatidyltransferase [Frankiales bacterium]